MPALEEGTAFESMMAAGYVTPQDEFGVFDRPRFLEEQLAEGERHLAEQAAAATDRAAKRLKDQLGGKP